MIFANVFAKINPQTQKFAKKAQKNDAIFEKYRTFALEKWEKL